MWLAADGLSDAHKRHMLSRCLCGQMPLSDTTFSARCRQALHNRLPATLPSTYPHSTIHLQASTAHSRFLPALYALNAPRITPRCVSGGILRHPSKIGNSLSFFSSHPKQTTSAGLLNCVCKDLACKRRSVDHSQELSVLSQFSICSSLSCPWLFLQSLNNHQGFG